MVGDRRQAAPAVDEDGHPTLRREREDRVEPIVVQEEALGARMQLDAARSAVEAAHRLLDRLLGEVETNEGDEETSGARGRGKRAIVRRTEGRVAVGLVEAEAERAMDTRAAEKRDELVETGSGSRRCRSRSARGRRSSSAAGRHERGAARRRTSGSAPRPGRGCPCTPATIAKSLSPLGRERRAGRGSGLRRRTARSARGSAAPPGRCRAATRWMSSAVTASRPGEYLVRLAHASLEHLASQAEHDHAPRILEREHEATLRVIARLLELVGGDRLGRDPCELRRDRA